MSEILYYRFRPPRGWALPGVREFEATRPWSVYGVTCSHCERTWATTGVEYPQFDATGLPVPVDDDNTQRVLALNEWFEIRDWIKHHVCDCMLMRPGMSLGRLTGHAASLNGHAYWMRSFQLPLFHRSAIDDLNTFLQSPLISVETNLVDDSGATTEYVEVEPAYVGTLLEPETTRCARCEVCGYEGVNTHDSNRVRLGVEAHVPDLFRVANAPTMILCSSRFRDACLTLNLDVGCFDDDLSIE